MRTLIEGVRLVDADTDSMGSILIENGRIAAVYRGTELSKPQGTEPSGPDGSSCLEALSLGTELRLAPGKPGRYMLLPAFVELHAHLRDPGFPEKETLESGSLAAAAGGYGTLVCMGNTKPPLDSVEAVHSLTARAEAIGKIDLYPVMTMTRGMAGSDSSHLDELAVGTELQACRPVKLLSEDGKDVANEGAFLTALKKAASLGIPVSCHCDFGGKAAEDAKARGESRSVWSRIEEDVGTERAIALGIEAGAHVHIAHVSTARSVAMIREAKKELALCTGAMGQSGDRAPSGPRLTCEASPLHFSLTEADAERLGAESHGRVNPPLRNEEDRLAVLAGILDGTIDAIATDHAPHTYADKAGGSPGFVGLETAYSISKRILVDSGLITMSRLSTLMSARPATILGLGDRAFLEPGKLADLVLVDLERDWEVDPERFQSRGKNTPFKGLRLTGKVVATWHRGHLVYEDL